jgi:ABC-type lipoprotein export system ATPase subunit
MFQEYRLFPTLGALKNAAISNENNIDKAHALLSRLGFEENDMKKKPRELSGGMKQRVAFARAVLKPAPILILDEPTKELDFETVATIHEVIAEEAKKRLVIVVTHDDITDFLTSASVIRL